MTVKAEEDGGMLRIDFIDSGIGIDPSEHERVFEKFTGRATSGSIRSRAAGWALRSREIVRLHGGDITLDSQVGKGSTFTLTLPAAMRGGLNGETMQIQQYQHGAVTVLKPEARSLATTPICSAAAPSRRCARLRPTRDRCLRGPLR